MMRYRNMVKRETLSWLLRKLPCPVSSNLNLIKRNSREKKTSGKGVKEQDVSGNVTLGQATS